jgi:caa(3)-type oxidase subunit IV
MSAGEHAHESHAKTYAMVLAALLVLTIVTVGLSYVDLTYAGNKILGLLVAISKAALVVALFMHLKHDGAKDKYLLVALFFPLVLLLIIIFSNFPDVVYRGGDQAKRWEKGPWDVKHVEATKDGSHH